jgi:hypothetical protein
MEAERARIAPTLPVASPNKRCVRYAPERFGSAQAKEREAKGALGRRDYTAATPLFGSAQAEYQEAKRETEQKVVLERERTDAERARNNAAAARGAAEQAGASPRPGTVPIGPAEGAEASAAFGRADYRTATPLFGNTQSEYQEAKREAEQRSRSSGSRLTRARQGQHRSCPSQRGAERCSSLAKAIYLGSDQGREAEAGAALG